MALVPARRKSPMAEAQSAGKANGRVVRGKVANGTAGAPRGVKQQWTHETLGLPPDRLRQMFEKMLLARLVDERQSILNRQGGVAFHISCQGHEASGVGSAFALDPARDVMVPYYRSLAAVLAFGLTPLQAFLSALARATDPMTGGRQMPAHYGLPPRILTSGSSVATQIPHATGAALASKIRGDGGVCIVYFGDGASSKGDFHEGLNFAAIHKVPAIFVCENNHFAISVPTSKQMAVLSVADRAVGYGLFGESIDGTDPLEVYRAVKTAADRARAGEGPTLIESNVVRLTPHSSDDDDRRYRLESDREEARHRDPINVFRRYLLAHGVLDAGAEAEMKARLQREVAEALAEAESAPEPAPESAFDNVYGGTRAINPFHR